MTGRNSRWNRVQTHLGASVGPLNPATAVNTSVRDAIASGSSRTPANSPAQTWLAVHGLREGIPPEPMIIEVGEAAWSITSPGGGLSFTHTAAAVPEVSEAASVDVVVRVLTMN